MPAVDSDYESMRYEPGKMLSTLLRDVSRSFYVTLRVLPRAVRPQISLAYLLARTSDTIADTGLVPVERRLAALRDLKEQILGSTGTIAFTDFVAHQGSVAERVLLERCQVSLDMLRGLSELDRSLVRSVLQIIISGQELDLTRFSGADLQRLAALRTAEELDDYTYRVAGCVGEFWTRMCLAHVFSRENCDSEFLLKNGVRFGKGLQLVNVLRDLPRDLRAGRCYLPMDELAAAGLTPGDLLESGNQSRAGEIYYRWVAIAHAHLDAGWQYTLRLPKGSARIRLACAWPLLLGVRTLELLRKGHFLDSSTRIKVSRSEVRSIMFQSVLWYPFRSRWEGLYQSASQRH